MVKILLHGWDKGKVQYSEISGYIAVETRKDRDIVVIPRCLRREHGKSSETLKFDPSSFSLRRNMKRSK